MCYNSPRKYTPLKAKLGEQALALKHTQAVQLLDLWINHTSSRVSKNKKWKLDNMQKQPLS